MNLDKHFAPRGACGLCGHPDARHRIYDAMSSRHSAGESVEEIADDYDTTPEVVREVLARNGS
jgi:hypothetical protein